ncbi:MAG TPA: response regulator transcription factor [Bryobacteraceae bacterium]|nr:response regulator transcription factor [Bryobacteraceae bacterium]
MSTSSSLAANPLPKVLLADDHHFMLDAICAMMKDQFDVLAVDNSKSFLQAAASFQPDIAILDISMPGGDGFITGRKLLELQPELPLVFLSMYTDSSYIEQAAQVGAKAYLSKRVPARQLISAISAVLEGRSFLASSSPSSGKEGPAGVSGNRNGLTARQREVLRLIALGCSAKDIASQLNISVRTAEFHRAAIMQRLGLRSTAQMTRYAIANEIA